MKDYSYKLLEKAIDSMKLLKFSLTIANLMLPQGGHITQCSTSLKLC